MAACVRCRRVPWLRCLPGLRNAFTQAQHLYGKTEDETDAQEAKKQSSQHQEASLQGGSRLYYKPSSYHHHLTPTLSQTVDDDEEQSLYTLPPSLWRPSNHHSVSYLRHLSSSENTHLDFAFNHGPEAEMPSVSQYSRHPIPPVVRVDTRGFQKCRPDYASMTLDLTQRPQTLEWEEAIQMLQKVAVLKGSMKPSDVSQFFVELSRLHPDNVSLVKSNQRFVMLLRYSVVNLRLFTDLQLLQVLQSFVWLDMPPDHPVLGLYETELSRRANQMTLHQLLFAADLWRCIKRPVPQFLQHLYDLVHPYLGYMGVPELVQLVYIVGECRQFPEGLIYPVQQLLMRHLQQLHPEEVGCVCLALFKSNTSLSQSAVTFIVDKAHSSVKEMSDFAMVNVLKILRFSYLSHKAWMKAMTQEVPLRAPGMGVKGLMHVALTCSSLHYRNDDILLAIAERVPSLASHCRSKDSCKLLWAFGTLGFLPVQSPRFYPSLTEALRQKISEFRQYPHHLLTGLLGLAFASQFPEDLIALALSPDFVKLALQSPKLDLKPDLFTLDGTVALEFPQWTGPRLSPELREKVAELLWKHAQSDVCLKPEVQEAEAVLQHLLGGEEFVSKRMILPHTRSIDLEVHLDSAGQPIPVHPAFHTTALIPQHSSSKFTVNQGLGKMNESVDITEELLTQLINSKSTTGPRPPSPQPNEKAHTDTGLYLTSDLIAALTKNSSPDSAPPDAGGTVKLAIQVSLRKHHCCDSQQLVGIHAMKRRQLKLAGYKVVEISNSEWFPMLGSSRSEKMEFMRGKVYDGR